MSFSGYEWVNCRCRCDMDNESGEVSYIAEFTYHATGAKVDGRDTHDENVEGWTDERIQELGCDLLCIDKKHKSKIHVEWD